MAKADDYAKWIVANQDKKGTPEFETVAAAYREAKAEEEAGGNEREYTLRQALGSAPFELIPSLYRNIIEPVVERPKETLAAGAGLLSEMVLGPGPSPETSRAIREDYARAYGSPERVLRTIAEDPARPLLDVSMLAYGTGGALRGASGLLGSAGPPRSARIAGLRAGLERAGEGAETVARVTDPFGLIGAGANLAGGATTRVLGLTTGVGPYSLSEAYRAGKAGGEKAFAFRSQMRGDADTTQVVDEARRAVDNMRAERAQNYRSGMIDIKNDKTVLDFGRIDNTLSSIRDRGFYAGKEIDRSAAGTWEKINELVTEWKNADPRTFHTPEGLDALKKAIEDIRGDLPFGSKSRNVADNAYNAVKREITTQAPAYAKVMEDYEKASTLIKEVESSLSLNKKAQADQALRKLQSILRDNVQTSYGRRRELGAELEKYGAENLMAQIAGQSLGSWMPRGLVGGGTATASGIAALSTQSPAALAAIPLTMPRLTGEAAYMTGRVRGAPASFARMLDKQGAKLATRKPEYAMAVDAARRAIQTGSQIDPFILRQLTAQLGRLEQEEEE